jgi:hypothetical protein
VIKLRSILLTHAGIALLLGVVWLNLRINIMTNREMGREIKRQLDSSGRADVDELRARVARLEGATKPVKP